jgi:hypothetical protein
VIRKLPPKQYSSISSHNCTVQVPPILRVRYIMSNTQCTCQHTLHLSISTISHVLLRPTFSSRQYLHVITTPWDVQRNTSVLPNVLRVLLPSRPSISFKVVTLNHSCKKECKQKLLPAMAVLNLKFTYVTLE